jgi:ABC-2 type transport system ATP-binding protein
MSDEVVIKVEHVSKDFILPHEKVNSIKGLFTGLAKGKARKTKETQHALRDVSFEVKKGEFFGIVGRNGSGKSTMLKMLAGIYQPTKGKVYTNGKLVPFIELGVGFNPELTGRENVYLNGAMMGFSEKQIDAMYDDIVEFAELAKFMDQKLKNYSTGMQVRLAFSVAIKAQADILLVDEILAVGDADFQRKCFEYFRSLKKERKTVIFVTHDMNAVREYCNRAMLVNKSRVEGMGRPEDIAQKYSQLFIEENPAGGTDVKPGNRWGNGKATYYKISVKLQGSNVIINASVHANTDLNNLLYGVHVFSSDGTELTATNNRMVDLPDIEKLSKGERLELQWEILNIFNDGKYFITVTLVDSVGTVCDWVNEAAYFVVKRSDRSTTHIIPPIKADVIRYERQGASND